MYRFPVSCLLLLQLQDFLFIYLKGEGEGEGDMKIRRMVCFTEQMKERKNDENDSKLTS